MARNQPSTYYTTLPAREVVKREPQLTTLRWVAKPGQWGSGRFEEVPPYPSGYYTETLSCGHVYPDRTGAAKRRRCPQCGPEAQ